MTSIRARWSRGRTCSVASSPVRSERTAVRTCSRSPQGDSNSTRMLKSPVVGSEYCALSVMLPSALPMPVAIERTMPGRSGQVKVRT